MSQPTFSQKVIAAIKQVPAGKVATYGQIAALAGSPRSARIVGQILRHQTEAHQLPWQRIVGKDGVITIAHFDHPAEIQAELLMAEGVQVKKEGGLWQCDLKKYLYRVEETE